MKEPTIHRSLNGGAYCLCGGDQGGTVSIVPYYFDLIGAETSIRS